MEQKNGPGSDLVKKFLQKMSAENGLSTWIRNVSDKNIVVSYQCMWILFFFNKPEREKEGDFFYRHWSKDVISLGTVATAK